MTDYLEHVNNFDDPDLGSVLDELSYWAAPFGMLLFKHIKLAHNLTVLDLGCGTGFPLFELARVLGSSCHCIGIDPWTTGLKRAQFRLSFHQSGNVNLVRGDGATMPFPDATFNLITANLIVNNLDQPSVVLAECARITKPGGRFILTSNIKGHYREFYDVYRAVLTDFGNTHYLERLAANEAHRGTRESVCTLLEQADFKIARVVEDQFTTRFLDANALFHHFLIQVGFLDGWRGIIDSLDDQRAIFADLEHRLNEVARQQGELKMTVPMLYVEAER
jgi:ubiquinone/menaquinone biosynthesis C-methylase UbiE